MSTNSRLEFSLNQLLYGAASSVVISSTVNNSLYNLSLSGFSGLDVLGLNSGFTFNSETKLTFKVTAKFVTNDSVLAAYTLTAGTVAYDVFKIVPAASQTFSAMLFASPD